MKLLKSMLNSANFVHKSHYYLMNMNGTVLPVKTTSRKGINELLKYQFLITD